LISTKQIRFRPSWIVFAGRLSWKTSEALLADLQQIAQVVERLLAQNRDQLSSGQSLFWRDPRMHRRIQDIPCPAGCGRTAIAICCHLMPDWGGEPIPITAFRHRPVDCMCRWKNRWPLGKPAPSRSLIFSDWNSNRDGAEIWPV